jgi:2-polyprenyl-3-methyl-5-hydroxy-6-metoxy-1,4-benzoquinol methylase
MQINKDQKFWNTAASKYAKSKIGDEKGYERSVARTRDFLKPDSNILELGCGTGTTALKLAPFAGTYLATDISPAMIAIANEKLSASDQKNLEFRCETAETIAQTAKGFDVILGFNYLHLVSDPVSTLQAIKNLLKPDGILITKTVCLKEMNAAIPLLVKVMRLFGKAPDSVKSFDEPWLIAAHKEADFEILFNERHGTKGKDVRPYIVAQARALSQ